jgi:hypothetical protein
MKNITSIFVMLAVLTAHLWGSEYSITPSFILFPSNTFQQSEPVIAVSPLNPMIMFCSGYTLQDGTIYRSEGIFASTNGGLNWFGTDSCLGGPNINNHGGDPGIAIDKNGIFLLTHIGNGTPYGVFAHYSNNMGSTWSSAVILTQGVLTEDKGTMTTDTRPSSTYYGRSYAAWVNFQAPFPVLFSYTSNSGLNWVPNAQVNPGPLRRCSGGDIKTGPLGEVYVTWAGVSDTLPSTERLAGFASSSNGGTSWNVSQNIFGMSGIAGFLPTKSNIRVNGIPRLAIDNTSGARQGWIYIITNEKNNSPAGSDPDILFHRSTDGGQTWSQGIRVNQDPVNNGKIQYFPAICVDSTGAINVLYYDDRNTTSDSAQVYISRSTTGGDTWYDFQVSDKTFHPQPIPGAATGYQGDFISITSARNKLFPVWMANYTGRYQIWMTILDIDLIGIKKISSNVPTDYELKQNYPNPFNPSTKIKFDIRPPLNPLLGKQGTGVVLKIYDILGRKVSTLVNGLLQPGSYEATWDASGKPSGVYFYELTTDSFKETKKMVLAK